jgi:TonB-dependent SusC/RagA subfamily outer membrane receptor
MAIVGLLAGITMACGGATTTSEADRAVVPGDTITAADLTAGEKQKRTYEPIDALLRGRTAGVDARLNPDGSLTVRIRGAESFYGSTAPLYVVDGVPYESGRDGALRGINPNDIESIEVLKGPPETTMYGVRGANGVVLIKTKRP